MLNRMRVLLALLVTVTVTVAQRFEVASVKPGNGSHSSMNGGPGTTDPGRISYENLTLRGLLINAYDIGPAQLSGPGWIDNERFSITAKLPPGSTKKQFRDMLRN